MYCVNPVYPVLYSYIYIVAGTLRFRVVHIVVGHNLSILQNCNTRFNCVWVEELYQILYSTLVSCSINSWLLPIISSILFWRIVLHFITLLICKTDSEDFIQLVPTACKGRHHFFYPVKYEPSAILVLVILLFIKL